MADETTNDSSQTHTTPLPVAEVDWFLQHFINLANNPAASVELSLVLNVGGFLVSGTLVGGKKYFAAVAELLSSANTNMPEISEVWKGIANYGKIYEVSAEEGEGNKNPQYLHLQNAKTFSTSGTPIQAGPGGWWRGRVAEVSGFSFGSLQAN